MRKLFKALLIIVFIFIATWSYTIHGRVYLDSPDKTKVVTVYRPFYMWSNTYYFIPYKYTNVFQPMGNYCIYSPKRSLSVLIDWNPSDGKYLHIAPYDLFYNHLANDIRIGSEKEFDNNKDGVEVYYITGELGVLDEGKSNLIVGYFYGLFFGTLLLTIAILSVLLFILFMVRLIQEKYFGNNKE